MSSVLNKNYTVPSYSPTGLGRDLTSKSVTSAERGDMRARNSARKPKYNI